MNRRTVLKGLLAAPLALMGCPAREEPKPVPQIVPSPPDVKWRDEDEYHAEPEFKIHYRFTTEYLVDEDRWYLIDHVDDRDWLAGVRK